MLSIDILAAYVTAALILPSCKRTGGRNSQWATLERKQVSSSASDKGLVSEGRWMVHFPHTSQQWCMIFSRPLTNVTMEMAVAYWFMYVYKRIFLFTSLYILLRAFIAFTDAINWFCNMSIRFLNRSWPQLPSSSVSEVVWTQERWMLHLYYNSYRCCMLFWDLGHWNGPSVLIHVLVHKKYCSLYTLLRATFTMHRWKLVA